MFSYSECPRCHGSSFETVIQEPTGSKFKLIFVQCTGCNTPIGVLDFMNIGAMIGDQDDMIAKLDRRLSKIEQTLDALTQAVRHLHGQIS